MILTSVGVRHWRGLAEATLEELSPGLNLVLGPNESGKSRLVEALWFALFESSKGRAEHKRSLQTWGRAEGPWVEVGFRVGEQAYRVSKQFLVSPGTILEGRGQTWKGEEAEEQMAQLLGTARASRRAEAGDLGVWPLLWVRQFESNLPPHADLNEETRGRLHDLLAEEVGQIAVGPAGLAVLERARAEAGRYWTATGRATGELRAAQEGFEGAQRVLAAARARKEELHGTAAALDRAQGELEGLGERSRARRAALEAARARAQEAGQVARDLAAQEAGARLAQQRMETARGDLTLRQERDAALQERDRDIATAGDRVDALRERQVKAAALLTTEEEELRAARERHRGAKETLRRAAAQERRRAAMADLQGLEKRLGEARTASEELKELGRAAGALRVDRTTVERLRSLTAEAEKADARLTGASARLEIVALGDLTASGEPLVAGDNRVWMCAEPTVVEIQGVARIAVTPGGEDLPRLREEATRRRVVREDLLAETGVTSLAEAEAQWEARQDLERRTLQLAGFLKACCPEGLPVLEAQVEKARQVLGDLGPEEEATVDQAVARAEVEAAAEAEEQALTRRDAPAAVLAALRVDLGVAEQRARGLCEERDRLARLAEQMAPPEDLEAVVSAAERSWQESLAVREGLRHRYEALGGDGAADDLRREEAALAALDDQRRELERNREQLVGRLGVLQGEALHEEEQDAEAAWTRARQTLDVTTRWAEAARTLTEALLDARREAQERLTAPVRAQVEPYLRQVFPGSVLGLSDDWEVKGLATGNLEEPFAELSGGAREQLGVIVRLGLGELLAGDDRLPLVLDDALPNTDFERVERLHRVLYQAAKKLQILIFSCHPEAFDGLGADRTYRLPVRTRG